jgi:hypothetical protein
MQCRLRHADMRLDADDDEGIPLQLVQSIGKGAGLEAIKFQFYDGLNILQFLMKLRRHLPKVLLFREEDWQSDEAGELDEPDGILNHPLPARDDGKEPLLQVNHHQECVIRAG